MDKIKIKFGDSKSCKVVIKMAKDAGLNVYYKKGLMGGNYLVTTQDNKEKIGEIISRYDRIKSKEDEYEVNSGVVNTAGEPESESDYD